MPINDQQKSFNHHPVGSPIQHETEPTLKRGGAPPNAMNVKAAAKALECSTSLVYALIEEGRLKCIRLGRQGKRGKIVVLEEHLHAFRNEVKAEAEAR